MVILFCKVSERKEDEIERLTLTLRKFEQEHNVTLQTHSNLENLVHQLKYELAQQGEKVSRLSFLASVPI